MEPAIAVKSPVVQSNVYSLPYFTEVKTRGVQGQGYVNVPSLSADWVLEMIPRACFLLQDGELTFSMNNLNNGFFLCQAKGLHFKHTDNFNFWLNTLRHVGLPKVSMQCVLNQEYLPIVCDRI